KITNAERDEAVKSILDDYGWKLEIYSLERMRLLLETKHEDLIAKHPAIFTPSFFQSTPNKNSQNHLLVNADPKDYALAKWLVRRLTAEGYAVWFEELKLLGGETYPENIDQAIKNEAFRVIGLYSDASLKNPEVMRQRAVALSVAGDRKRDFLIPLSVDGINKENLDKVTASLQFISFERSWAKGLKQLLEKLQSIDTPKILSNGRQIAAESFLGKDILLGQPEILISNLLEVEKIPEAILRFQSPEPIPYNKVLELELMWPFRYVKGGFLSFQTPPPSVAKEYKIRSAGAIAWTAKEEIDGINSRKLVSELIKKSLSVFCGQRGLEYCNINQLRYFPKGAPKLKYIKADGSKGNVSVIGERKFWRPNNPQMYVYHLAPDFRAMQKFLGDFTVLFKLKLRFTDSGGTLLPSRTAFSRRKHLCKGWWNEDWLNRMLAICQYLAPEGKIVIGETEDEQIVINASPVKMHAPEGIREGELEEESFDIDEIIIKSDVEDENTGIVELEPVLSNAKTNE
ncbi:MAG TPA: toll/interleukin-1 receptor domain-containing protein, partial [Patescibacteria group bacterium]|nr:toll/interleukin-1 receptor domain-containing protein [Patescibacteria group bacterium]